MKKIVFNDDPSTYTVAQMGLIFDCKAAYEEQEDAAQEFYNSVNLDEKQTDLLNNYIAFRLDAESALTRFFKGYGGGDDIKQSNEKADTAKQDFLNAAALDKNEMILFDSFSRMLGISQSMYLNCLFSGIRPDHIDKVPMLSFEEILKKLRAEEGMYESDLAEILGLSVTNIRRLEAGAERPSNTLLKLMFHEFNISFDFLMASRDAAKRNGA